MTLAWFIIGYASVTVAFCLGFFVGYRLGQQDTNDERGYRI